MTFATSSRTLTTRRFLLGQVLTEQSADSPHPALAGLQRLLEVLGRDAEAVAHAFTGEALLCLYDPGEINEIVHPAERELRISGALGWLAGVWWLSGNPALRGRSRIFEIDARVVRSRGGRLGVFQLRAVFDLTLGRFLRVTLRRAA